MIEEYMENQPIAYNIIKRTVLKKNISHAYLIETNGFYRGLNFAVALAKTLLCPKNNLKPLDCEKCTQCQKIDNHNFTELEIIEPDGNSIKKEQLTKLQKDFSTKSLEASKKIYIINHADKLNDYSANSILKFLEEPEANIVAILVVNNCNNLLDTIISRCQKIKLNNIKNNDVKNELDIISSYLCNSSEENLKFKKENESNNIVESCVKFVLEYERIGLDILLNENSYCGVFLKDKQLFEKFLNTMVLFYKDSLNWLINNKIEIFFEHQNEIKKVIEKNNIYLLSNKIKNILKIKERLRDNCNLNLLLDKLIILLKEGE